MKHWIAYVVLGGALIVLAFGVIAWGFRSEWRKGRVKPTPPVPTIDTKAPARHRAQDLGGATTRISPVQMGSPNTARAYVPEQKNKNVSGRNTRASERRTRSTK